MLRNGMGICSWTALCIAFLVSSAQRVPAQGVFGLGEEQSCVINGDSGSLSGGCVVGISLTAGDSTIAAVRGEGYVDDYDYDDQGDIGLQFPLNPELIATSGNIDENEETRDIASGEEPYGIWETVVSGHVLLTPKEAWDVTPSFGHFLVFAFGDLATTVLAQDDNFTIWSVELQSGEELQFEVEENNKEFLYHVATLVEHGFGLFKGTNIEGSRWYFHILAGEQEGTAQLEIGWGGSPRSGGTSDEFLVKLKSFTLEMIARLETRFGGNCEFARAQRTIDGRCNNLRIPSWGATNQPLRRFGNHVVESRDGATEPSGAKDISPRLISNMLFSQSPGADILDDNLGSVNNECLKTSKKGITWEVCPYQRAKASRGREVIFNLDWNGKETNDEKMLVMKFGKEAAGCQLNVVFACDGVRRLEFRNDPCSSATNYFFHPRACQKQPGDDNVLINEAHLSDLFWAMGQFIDHDLDLTPVQKASEGKQPVSKRGRTRKNEDELPIDIPGNDFFFSNSSMEFQRSVHSNNPDQASHINLHSAFADLGQVYGMSLLRANALRSFVDGKLKMGTDNLLPFNMISGINALGAKVQNDPNATHTLYAAGDIRANEQTLLLCLHTLWVREHNLVCDELKEAFPTWDDERIYQMARSIVISEYQSIVWGEWLPLLLGANEVAPGDHSYDIEVDPTINAVFSTVAFRFGHSMVGSYLWKQGPGPRGTAALELLPLREVFFRPSLVTEAGIDSFLRGGAWHLAQEVDIKVVDELRNFLFTEDPREPHLDLMALNIQRGRDMRMPSFNELRGAYNLSQYRAFSDIVPHEFIYSAMNQVYHGDIKNVDPFVGGLSEPHVEGSILGETFHTIIKDQFTRIRDGDRFFYTGVEWDDTMLTEYPRLVAIVADEVRLADIITRNTEITPEELGIGPRYTVFQL